MHLYDDSTSRRAIWSVKVNWHRQLTFSERQINYIAATVPHVRGVYCIFAKDAVFRYRSRSWPTDRFSRVVYIGSGWLDNRLVSHLNEKKNYALADLLERHQLAYRYDEIVDDDDELDWPRTLEAHMIELFQQSFGKLPPANRRRESVPDIPIDVFNIEQSANFNFLKRG